MIPIRTLCGTALAALAVVFGTALAPAHAADRQPLVLDTQRGISDGQSGVVLQNAPLSRAPIVNAQSPGRPVELAPDAAQQPVIVSPYVEWSGANGGAQPTRPRSRRATR